MWRLGGVRLHLSNTPQLCCHIQPYAHFGQVGCICPCLTKVEEGGCWITVEQSIFACIKCSQILRDLQSFPACKYYHFLHTNCLMPKCVKFSCHEIFLFYSILRQCVSLDGKSPSHILPNQNHLWDRGHLELHVSSFLRQYPNRTYLWQNFSLCICHIYTVIISLGHSIFFPLFCPPECLLVG